MTKKGDLHVVMMGLGYIGLPTAALIASRGIKVTGVDIKQDVVDTINRGEIHIIEPDLEGLVQHTVRGKMLQASTTPTKADVFLIAVPTPFKGDHEPDLSYIEACLKLIIPVLEEGNLLIIESTSPVGTTAKVKTFIDSITPGLSEKIQLAYCPERVLPGNVIHELEHNDRVIGGLTEQATDAAVKFYRHFVKGELLRTNAQTAEMCKLVENSSRDVSIAFANELSMICEKADINVWELIELANHHPRVNILQPGTGVGGHCIAVDPWFIVSAFKKEAKIIRQAREINNYKTEWVIEKIEERAAKFEKETGKKPKIGCFGLAFKPDIDDLRESPALYVTEQLIKKGYDILPVEPNLQKHPKFDLVDYEKANVECDIAAFLVKHKAFLSMSITPAKSMDFCGLLRA